jgi:putative protease
MVHEDTKRDDLATTPTAPAPGRLILPELLSPAGNMDCARAAVENGADAIYFGLESFNARMRADNFTVATLPQLMEYLHRRGVRGYACFNTLVFDDEIAEGEAQIRAMIAAGVDAAVVQDVGMCRLIRSISPDFPMHASTQMTVTSAAGVEFVQELGCDLVVLSRECSIQEIALIHQAEPEPALPLEVFIHGALCVAYSGQCLTSEALGGRSANRGVCAQACRMPYDLICDGQPVPLGDRRYLLSPQDLVGLELIPQLIQAGVYSLKIEGRLKTPEYVANITRIYREALDKAGQKIAVQAGAYRYDMEMSFSRGLYTGWLGGINNQELVHGRFGKKRGVYLGAISRIQGEKVLIKLEGPLKLGDGVVFDAARPEDKEEGGRVYEVRAMGGGNGETLVAFGHGDIDFSRVHVGDKLWKTGDPELERRLRQTFTGDQVRYQRPVDIAVSGSAASPMTVRITDGEGHVAQANSQMPLAIAEKHPLTSEKLRDQLARLGGTPFKLGQLTNDLVGSVILPVSELNRLRREVVTELERLRIQPLRWTVFAEPQLPASLKTRPSIDRNAIPTELELIVLTRSLSQLEVAIKCGVKTLYCEFDDPKQYREAVRMVHESCACTGPQKSIWVAPPRICKPGEEWILKQVRSSDADGYLLRNYDHLKFFAGDRCIGDYSLNIANRWAADYFKNRFKLERLTVSYDLNIYQLESLLRSSPPSWFEITLHQHMPMFHMEHCVFCAFLSQGTDYTNCGRPCDKHEIKLRDRVGAEHPVKADAGCRNTVFSALAQTGADAIGKMLELGARHFRIEFVNETPSQVERTITRYRQLLRGEITGAQLWTELKLVNQLGVTRGQMQRDEAKR